MKVEKIPTKQRVNAVNPATGKVSRGVLLLAADTVRFGSCWTFGPQYALREVAELGTIEYREKF